MAKAKGKSSAETGLIIATICLFITSLACSLNEYFAWECHFLNSLSKIHIIKTFIEHAWLEIGAGLIIAIVLDKKFGFLTDRPTLQAERPFKKIYEGVKESKREVLILENDFSSFFSFSKDKSKAEGEQRKEKLKAVLTTFLRDSDKDGKLRILLLHPDTQLALQRQEDLLQQEQIGHPEIDFFAGVNEGFQFLFDLIEDLQIGREKIDVRLFSTSYSIVFVLWDNGCDFSLLSPGKIDTNENTFTILRKTPLVEDLIEENFKAIWDSGDTIELKDYKTVTLEFEIGTKIEGLWWGHDHRDHNAPVFLWIKEGDKNEGRYKEDIKNQLNKRCHVLHNGKHRPAVIQQVSESYREYVEEQIRSKNPSSVVLSGTDNLKLENLFRITYLDSKKITLLNPDFVYRQLLRKGYCYTAHTQYEVTLGMHVKNMLVNLFDFFENQTTSHSESFNFSCKFSHGRIAEPDWKASNASTVDTKLSKDFKSITESDIIRINGSTRKQNHKGNSSKAPEQLIKDGDYHVSICMIRTVVSSKTSKNRVELDLSLDPNSNYTVFHSAGRKNIHGGLIQLEGKNRTYDLASPLDTLFISKDLLNTIKTKPILFAGSVDSSVLGYHSIIKIEIKQSHNTNKP